MFKKKKARLISSDVVGQFLNELELRAFIAIAATTGLRKGSILPLKFSNVFLDSEVPYVYVGRTFVATVMFMKGVPDAMIAKVKGHRSRELKRYQHLSPEFRKQTVEMIAGELSITNRITQLSSDLVQ